MKIHPDLPLAEVEHSGRRHPLRPGWSHVRKQMKSHWIDFLAEEENICRAEKDLKSRSVTSENLPLWKKLGGSTARDKAGQPEELLETFFAPIS